jgi:hypothetical protein
VGADPLSERVIEGERLTHGGNLRFERWARWYPTTKYLKPVNAAGVQR